MQTLIPKPYNRNGITNFLKENMLTNCITEIPQRIKLELNESTLTLKSGSVVIVPNGFEEDRVTRKFEYVTVESALSAEDIAVTRSNGVMFLLENGITFGNYPTTTYSGETAPSEQQYMLWYDTANNVVKRSNNNGATWTSGCSFPIGLADYVLGTGYTSINQIFNGFGYIGSCTWVDKGVKAFFADGRNPDGSMKNLEHEYSSCIINDLNEEFSVEGYLNKDSGLLGYGVYNYFIQSTAPAKFGANSARWFNPASNLSFRTIDGGVTWMRDYSIYLGKLTKTAVDKPITYLDQPQVYKLLDYTDLELSGKWTAKGLLLCNQQATTVLNKDTELSFDLSSYLPNDGKSYEVLINGYIFTGSSAESSLTVSAKTPRGFEAYICGVRTTTASDSLSYGSCIIVVDADRELRLQYFATGSQGQLRNFNIKGYKKVG